VEAFRRRVCGGKRHQEAYRTVREDKDVVKEWFPGSIPPNESVPVINALQIHINTHKIYRNPSKFKPP